MQQHGTPGDNGYFRGGGFSSRFVTKADACYYDSSNLVKGLGPVFQIAEGWTVNLPEEVSDKLWKRTDYTWPCTWFAPRCTGEGAFKTAYDVMNNWGANHGAILRTHRCRSYHNVLYAGIPVCMRNVPEEKIFRPRLERIRNGQRRRRLQSLQKLRTTLQIKYVA